MAQRIVQKTAAENKLETGATLGRSSLTRAHRSSRSSCSTGLPAYSAARVRQMRSSGTTGTTSAAHVPQLVRTSSSNSSSARVAAWFAKQTASSATSSRHRRAPPQPLLDVPAPSALRSGPRGQPGARGWAAPGAAGGRVRCSQLGHS